LSDELSSSIPGELPDDLLTKALQITSCFENDTPDLQWDYAEDLDDGRGWTCGIAGFTHEEAKYFKPTISPKDWKAEDFNETWAALAEDESFHELQLKVAQDVFAAPALAAFQERNCSLSITFASFYDTCIQHGDGDDPDSFGAILSDWNADASETDNLGAFLTRRHEVLLNPDDEDTQAEWAQSVSRVTALQGLLAENADLDYPINIVSQDFNHVIG
jgi:chitosanase